MISVAVIIVTWNGKDFLPRLFQSISEQTFKPKRILVVDNGSVDGTIELLHEWPTIRVLRNNRNLGFAHAYNQGMLISDADAVLIVNQDIILDPRCLERLVAVLEENPRVASVCPKLYRFKFSNDDLREPIYSAILDAAGLVVRRSRQALNRGEGLDAVSEFPEGTFGAPGVLALYRKSALNDVSPNGEYFDDDFFAYKEDVDLAWRFRWAGWDAKYVPDAIAYHHRSISHHNDSLTKVHAIRTSRPPLFRMLSYRNHILMMVKNESAATFFFHLPFILLYELRRLGYLLLREWSTLRAIPGVLRLLPKMRKKRRSYMQFHRIDPAVMRSFFSK